MRGPTNGGRSPGQTPKSGAERDETSQVVSQTSVFATALGPVYRRHHFRLSALNRLSQNPVSESPFHYLQLAMTSETIKAC